MSSLLEMISAGADADVDVIAIEVGKTLLLDNEEIIARCSPAAPHHRGLPG